MTITTHSRPWADPRRHLVPAPPMRTGAAEQDVDHALIVTELGQD